ncbi:ZN704 protein, partial [Polypterus senegalus]
MDSLSEGLSSLTPTSPTTTAPPPVFPVHEFPLSEPILAKTLDGNSMTPLSQSAPSNLCHIRTDHAYQATNPMSIPVSSKFAPNENGISISWQSPPVIFKGSPGVVTQMRTVNIAEKRQPVPHTTVSKTSATLSSAPKTATGVRYNETPPHKDIGLKLSFPEKVKYAHVAELLSHSGVKE